MLIYFSGNELRLCASYAAKTSTLLYIWPNISIAMMRNANHCLHVYHCLAKELARRKIHLKSVNLLVCQLFV